MGAFAHTLESLSPSVEGVDKMRWCLGSKGDFDIKSFYDALRGSSSITFPWKSIWFVKALRRVIFCLGSHMGEGSHNGPEKSLHYNGLVICRCNGRVWIICSYIVVRYFGYGALPLDILVFRGFYLRGLLTYWPAGGIGWGSILQMFGIWYLMDYLEGEK